METKNIIKRISEIPPTCFEQYLDLNDSNSDVLTQKGINFAGKSTLKTGYRIGMAEPLKTHIAIYTNSGEGYLKTPHETHQLTNSSCIIIPVGQTVEFGITNDHWDITWFYLDDIPHWDTLHGKSCLITNPAQQSRLNHAVDGYLTESNWNSNSSFIPYSSQRAVSLYAELILLYLDETLLSSSLPEDNAMSYKLESLWQKIRTNPSIDWNQGTMAAEINCSPSTLQRIVKQHYKTTPWKMVIAIKIEQAKLLLEMTSYPLKVIADRLGYADEFVFSSAFKKNTGFSPKAHRNNAKAARAEK